jgi:putative RecB family exonuclease
MDIIKTSYSALDTFRQCPLRYKFSQIDKVREPKSKEQVFGNKIHKALQFFHSKEPVSPTLDELLNFLKEAWESEIFIDDQEDMIYFGEAVKILKNYYNFYQKIKEKPIILNTETRFEVLLENKGKKALLKGFIDRVDKTKNGLEVIDYKTAKKLPSQKDIDSNLQLSLYCLGVIERWPQFVQQGIENIKLTFHFLKHQEKMSTKRTREQLDKVKEQVWQRLAEIDKSDFPPIPSALCDWCGYKKICPMWKHLFKEQISVDDEQVKKVVDEYFQLKDQSAQNTKRLNELKDIIENYLDKQELERVFGDSGYITRLTQTRFDYDKEKLKQLPYSEKKYKILKASKKKVKKEK